MRKKEIQANRMMKYFIDATSKIIEEDGIENVTIRKIADTAGYNSATIYSYFKEVSHLIFFAAMTFLKDYINDLSECLKLSDDPLEKYVLSWECFCKHSFANPKLYHAIFIADLGEHPDELMRHYYQLYNMDLLDIPEEIKAVMLEHNLMVRSRMVLESAVSQKLIKVENLEPINEMTIYIWRGMFTSLLNNRCSHSKEEALKTTVAYIRELTFNANHFNFEK
ncbi:TetR family transcriptional regulator [Pullulanibacillus camelliae]|uniref:TetR family transcriptional regulator n=1 Tax=Pullulanibacillus camelliae TaxID=1707096 RepID=A0A8J2YFZ7_9BACL|nr:TetR family transcriptional regulator [Pullulanibacillus camelliae]